MGNNTAYSDPDDQPLLQGAAEQMGLNGEGSPYRVVFINTSSSEDEQVQAFNQVFPYNQDVYFYSEDAQRKVANELGISERDLNSDKLSSIIPDISKAIDERVSPASVIPFQMNGEPVGVVFYKDNMLTMTPQQWMSAFTGIDESDLHDIPGTKEEWIEFVMRHEIGHIMYPPAQLGNGETLKLEQEADSLAITTVFSEAVGGLTPFQESVIAARALASINNAPTVFEDVSGNFDAIHATNGLLEPDGGLSDVSSQDAMRDLVEIKTIASIYAGHYFENNEDEDVITPYTSQTAEDLASLSEDGEMELEPHTIHQYYTFKAMQETGIPAGEAAQKYIGDYIKGIERYAPSLITPENEEQAQEMQEYYEQALKDLPHIYDDVQPLMQGFDADRQDGPNFDPDAQENQIAVVGENGPELASPLPEELPQIRVQSSVQIIELPHK